MKSSLLASLASFALLLFLVSCQSGNQSSSSMETNEELLADTLAYASLMDGFEQQFAAIEEEYTSASAEQKLALESRYEEIDQAMVEAQKHFVRDYPASPKSLEVLNEIDWSFESASEFREYLEVLDPSFHGSKEYRKLINLAGRMEGVEVGKKAPDFSMADEEGISQKLSEKYGASKYLLLDFWASHCGPCRIENANIRLAYDSFHDQGFDVLGVSTDTRKEQWINAIAVDSLIWTNVCSLEDWNENEVVGKYALRQVSQNFLLDNSGKIIATELRGEALFSTLEALLK